MISLSPTNLQLDNATDQARDILNLVITSDVNDYYLALGRKPFIRRQGFFNEVGGAPVIDQQSEFPGRSPPRSTASNASAVTGPSWSTPSPGRN